MRVRTPVTIHDTITISAEDAIRSLIIRFEAMAEENTAKAEYSEVNSRESDACFGHGKAFGYASAASHLKELLNNVTDSEV